jgi:hypothetical protein
MEYYKSQGYTEEQLLDYYRSVTLSKMTPEMRRAFLEKEARQQIAQTQRNAAASASSGLSSSAPSPK